MVALKPGSSAKRETPISRSRNAVVALKLDGEGGLGDVGGQEAGTPWWH